jgi:uncharacterized membrane protein YkoI
MAGLLSACASNDSDDDMEVALTLADVPEVVTAAAEAAVPGIELTEAELELEDGREVYELNGMKDGVEYEIDVTPEGVVVEVEQDDD